MERAEKVGLGVAGAGHVALFAILSLGVLWTAPKPPPTPPMEVTIADDVALQAKAPQAVTPPAQSTAPDVGTPEDAAPPPEPAPVVKQIEPPAPQPAPAPPMPQPKAAPPRPAPAVKPAPKAPPQPKAKPAPVAPAKPAKAVPKAASAPAVKPQPSTAKGTGATANATKPKPRGARSLDSIMSGIGADPVKSTSKVPQAATMSAQAAMNIGQKIKQQVQPCADRQVSPGPGAERIGVAIRLRINRDGSLAGRPVVAGAPTGVDDENGRYVQRVNDMAIASFVGCAPLRGLPADLYDVPNGWKDFTLRYKLPG